MKVFDLHSDLFTDIAWRKSMGENNIFDRIHYPRLKKGGIESVICVFWVEPNYRNNPFNRFQKLFQYVMEDLSSSEKAVLFNPFTKEPHHHPGKITIYLGLEGLTFIQGWKGESAEAKIESAFSELHDHNITHAIFAWNENNFLATGTGAFNEKQHDGLTNAGKFAVKAANNKNWLLDASHLDESSFWDTYHMSEIPIMASHSNVKSLCEHERNLSDSQLKAIASKGGIIGLNAYGEFVDKEAPTVDKFIDHAIYISDLVGIEHVAFGFDFVDFLKSYDLGSDFSSYTKGLEDVSQIPNLIDHMIKRGFSTKELEAICYNNAFHYIENMVNKDSLKDCFYYA
ncbi:peptidase [Heyndrickxia sporothermodurans]|nr:peptidase [Heyndrickxia sporothermodurans]